MSHHEDITYQQRLTIIQIISAAAMLITAVLFSVGLTFAATGGNAIQSSFNSNGTKIENQGLFHFGDILKQHAFDWFAWASAALGITIMGSTTAIIWSTNQIRRAIDPNHVNQNQTSSNPTIRSQSDFNNITQTYMELPNVSPAYSKISLTAYTGNKYFATRKRLAYHPQDKQFQGKNSNISEEISKRELKKPKGALPKGFETTV
jgi:hypothetical protein